MYYNLELVAELPELFPKITSLVWRDNVDDDSNGYNTVRPPGEIYDRSLDEWKHIESIVDHTNYLDIATHLIKSTQCDKLTRLNVSFKDYEEVEENGLFRKIVCRELLQELVQTINNAPFLRDVKFSKTAIRLRDLEDLHANLPQLRNLVLTEVHLHPNDNVSSIIPISTKPTLESFSLLKFHIIREGVGDSPATNATCSWISYVCTSYTNLQDFKLDRNDAADGSDIDSTRVVEVLKIAITKLDQLHTYYINFHSIPFCGQ